MHGCYTQCSSRYHSNRKKQGTIDALCGGGEGLTRIIFPSVRVLHAPCQHVIAAFLFLHACLLAILVFPPPTRKMGRCRRKEKETWQPKSLILVWSRERRNIREKEVHFDVVFPGGLHRHPLCPTPFTRKPQVTMSIENRHVPTQSVHHPISLFRCIHTETPQPSTAQHSPIKHSYY